MDNTIRVSGVHLDAYRRRGGGGGLAVRNGGLSSCYLWRYLLSFRNQQNAETVELARGIEPPTCGLQNRNRGVAQVVDDMGNPLVVTSDPHTQPVSSLCLSLPHI